MMKTTQKAFKVEIEEMQNEAMIAAVNQNIEIEFGFSKSSVHRFQSPLNFEGIIPISLPDNHSNGFVDGKSES